MLQGHLSMAQMVDYTKVLMGLLVQVSPSMMHMYSNGSRGIEKFPLTMRVGDPPSSLGDGGSEKLDGFPVIHDRTPGGSPWGPQGIHAGYSSDPW